MDLGTTLREDQLALFYEIGSTLDAGGVLVSHGFVPQWDTERPACLSPDAVGRLRAQLPEALLVSDDLQMQGLQRRFTTAQALPMGVAAGLDVLIVGNNLLNQEAEAEVLAETLEATVSRDTALQAKVRAALTRIGRRKAQFIGMRQRFPAKRAL
jgi:beta-N-acetylhexosaminidase